MARNSRTPPLPKLAARVAIRARWRCQKKDSSEDDTPPPPRPKKVENMPDYSLTVDVPVVTLDARVVQKNGLPLALPPDTGERPLQGAGGRRTTKDTERDPEPAPITAVLLVEFSETHYNFMYDARECVLCLRLQPEAGGLGRGGGIRHEGTHPRRLYAGQASDFGALNGLPIPGFRESNVWDAMFDTPYRLDRIPGHKEIVVVASGIDSMSHMTFDRF